MIKNIDLKKLQEFYPVLKDIDKELIDYEVIDDLQFENLKIIQNNKTFKFGTDAILLSNFVKAKNEEVVVDLGTGCGILPLLLFAKTKAKFFVGVEIQPYMAYMAQKSVELNNLKDKIKILNIDLKNVQNVLGFGNVDCVVCNPPYFKKGAAISSSNQYIQAAKHEILCTTLDCIKSASQLLKNGGNAFFVHQAERLPEISTFFSKNNLQIKTIQTVAQKQNAPPNIVLIKATKNANAGAKWLSPIVMYSNDGKYTDELKKIYSIK